MEQKLNSNSSAGAAADISTQPIVTTSADIAVNPMLGTVRFKFRAFNHIAKKMYKETKLGDVFKWQNEGQVQTIMQFSGVYDCNGIEIYEGDIVKLTNSIRTFEYFKNCFWLIHPDKGYKFPIHMVTDEHLKEMEIIGNIFENPELLGE